MAEAPEYQPRDPYGPTVKARGVFRVASDGSPAPAGTADDPEYVLGGGSRAYDWANGQKVAVSSTSAQSAAITATEVTLHATTDMFIAVGADPTAADAADSLPMLAGEKFTVQITSGHKVAAIRSTSDGSLFILPVA